MRKSNAMAIAVSIAILMILALITPNCESDGATNRGWGAAKNLGPHINSGSKDEHATFTSGGKTMIFASTREGGYGAYDLYQSRFKSGEWSKAEMLPIPINTQKDDFDPFVTPDGKKFYFTSDREGGFGDSDIYVVEKIR